MGIHVTPIPKLTVLTVPAFTLGTANAAGAAVTSIASNSTLLAFDATLPDAITYGQSGAVGAAAVASRRDHAHAMAADPANLVIVGTVVASGDDDLTITGIDSTYDTYMIALSDIVPGNDNVGAWLRVGDSSGVDSGSSDYAYHSSLALSSTTDYSSSASESAAQMVISGLGVGNASGEGFGAVLFLSSPSDGTNQAFIHGTYGVSSFGNVFGGGQMNGNRRAVIALDRIQFLFHAGTVATGRMTVWGVAHA